MIAHYALHQLHILPGTLLSLPREEQAFIIGSIKVKLENEKKEAAKLKRK